MIKDVIVNLSTGRARSFAGQYAISLAETFDAHLAGIAFAYDPILPPTGCARPASRHHAAVVRVLRVRANCGSTGRAP